MLLSGYTISIIRPECMPGAQSLHCIARLNENVSEALPYLNTVLGGFEYIRDPPSVTFKTQGKLITVHGRKIAINALKDETEAHKIVQWLQHEINDAWENRNHIVPSYKGLPRPRLLEVLKLLPKTNCKKCGQPTCMVFAVQVVEGGRGARDCPEINDNNRVELIAYLKNFHLDE